MADHATPNLPSSDFKRTAAFYAALGFTVGFKDEGWMILRRGSLTLEFFPCVVDPLTSAASCCLRVDDLDQLHAEFSAAGLPQSSRATPRLTRPEQQNGLRLFALVDPDGSLLRCIQNRS